MQTEVSSNGTSRERSDWTLQDRAADLACAAEVATRARLLATACLLLWLVGLIARLCGASSWPWAPPLLQEGAEGRWPVPLAAAGEIVSEPIGFGRGAALLIALLVAWLLAAFYWVIAARSAVFELSRGERISLGEAARFAVGRWRDWLGASGLIAGAAAFSAGGAALAGWLLNWTAGAVLVWIALPLTAVLLVVTAYALAGAIVAAPLAWCAVSVDCSDAFDATTRGYSYAFQRPIGALLHVLAALFAGAAICGVAAAVGWWIDVAALGLVERMLGDDASGLGTAFVALGRHLIWLVVNAYIVSYAATATTWFYLWRRCDIDDASPDEMQLNDAPPNYELPPIAEVEEVGGASSGESSAEGNAASDGET